MARAVIIFASEEGQTSKIALRVGDLLRERGVQVDDPRRLDPGRRGTARQLRRRRDRLGHSLRASWEADPGAREEPPRDPLLPPYGVLLGVAFRRRPQPRSGRRQELPRGVHGRDRLEARPGRELRGRHPPLAIRHPQDADGAHVASQVRRAGSGRPRVHRLERRHGLRGCLRETPRRRPSANSRRATSRHDALQHRARRQQRAEGQLELHRAEEDQVERGARRAGP